MSPALNNGSPETKNSSTSKGQLDTRNISTTEDESNMQNVWYIRSNSTTKHASNASSTSSITSESTTKHTSTTSIPKAASKPTQESNTSNSSVSKPHSQTSRKKSTFEKMLFHLFVRRPLRTIQREREQEHSPNRREQLQEKEAVNDDRLVFGDLDVGDAWGECRAKREREAREERRMRLKGFSGTERVMLRGWQRLYL
ncbi:hypothetical protein Vi05172_g13035 [Venturia inaequalis]|uniref:Uncharacterized protein n=1 Tax=Venturia inaequalis TaxID=5025 RepID=A0A8H3VRM7_VENIN|nr:hypothetical protein EG327_007705 [Venturia inaequalis]RDI76975.1 hypothetical protein Vi05172_g13035 [Venturia inaequalis]